MNLALRSDQCQLSKSAVEVGPKGPPYISDRETASCDGKILRGRIFVQKLHQGRAQAVKALPEGIPGNADLRRNLLVGKPHHLPAEDLGVRFGQIPQGSFELL